MIFLIVMFWFTQNLKKHALCSKFEAIFPLFVCKFPSVSMLTCKGENTVAQHLLD